jgi:hypothetical protein
MALRTLAAPLALLALAAVACETSADSQSGGLAGSAVDCTQYTSCGTCTPVLGCGWCYDSDGRGLCAWGPDQCPTTRFTWTWNPDGCAVVADAGVGATVATSVPEGGDAPGSEAGVDADAASAQDRAAPEGDAPLPTPDAFVSALMGPGGEAGAQCGFTSDQAFVQMGAAVTPVPSTAVDGSSQSGHPVHVSCKVDPGGAGGFDIVLNAGLDGLGGGAFSASGHVSAGGGTGIAGAFESAVYGTFVDTACTITLTYLGNSISPAGGAIASGRMWGHIDCPSATDSLVVAADGGVTTSTCDGHADFFFENCQ